MYTLLAQAEPVAEGTPETVTITTLQEGFQSTFNQLWLQIGQFLPNLVVALVVLVVGYIAAKVLARVAVALCEKVGLQRAAERSGLADSMKQAHIQRTVPQIIGLTTFWLLLLVFVLAAVDIVGLTAVSSSMQEVLAYIPKLIVATVIVVLGLLLASLLRGIIATSADRVGISFARQLATGCYYALVLVTFMVAFDQMNIKFDFLNYAILIVLGGLALGFGLSFGLGGRDVMGGIMAGYYVRQRLQAGDMVDVAGFAGKVREVGPVATIVETEENGLMHRHSIPNTRMLNEAIR